VSRFFTDKGRMVTPKICKERSGQNVFADLGLPHPEQELLKAQLTLQNYELIKQRDITQAEAAKLLSIKQPHVSLLIRNRAGSFSVKRLMDFPTARSGRTRTTISQLARRADPVYIFSFEARARRRPAFGLAEFTQLSFPRVRSSIGMAALSC